MLCLSSVDAAAQDQVVISIPTGDGPTQIGLDDQPNADCLGPAAIDFTDAQAMLVLDAVNHRVPGSS